jgi:NitT/TauT family transport system permease protein
VVDLASLAARVMNARAGVAAAIIGCVLLSLVLPLGTLGDDRVTWIDQPLALACACGLLLGAGALRLRGAAGAIAIVLCCCIGAAAPLVVLRQDVEIAATDGGFWLYLVAIAMLAVTSVRRVAAIDVDTLWTRYATPLLLGAWVLFFWQVLIPALQVPRVILPAPTAIWASLLDGYDTLLGDFIQTVLKAALAGYAIGGVCGFATGVLIDRSPFLQRGLLPLSALASTVPLVGVAPIMVMWFGFGWHSKAAVVAIMTFFPMLVNTLAGLRATGTMERDLMRSYAAGYGKTLLSLRLPMALPFIFNALKINSTLALIGAIIAEFFGSPTVGMGFRISTEAARMNMGLVWATILVAAVTGSTFYGVLAWLERRATFWHPAQRTRA